MRNRQKGQYALVTEYVGYAETKVRVIYRLFVGGRDKVAELPASEKRAARLLLDALDKDSRSAPVGGGGY